MILTKIFIPEGYGALTKLGTFFYFSLNFYVVTFKNIIFLTFKLNSKIIKNVYYLI